MKIFYSFLFGIFLVQFVDSFKHYDGSNWDESNEYQSHETPAQEDEDEEQEEEDQSFPTSILPSTEISSTSTSPFPTTTMTTTTTTTLHMDDVFGSSWSRIDDVFYFRVSTISSEVLERHQRKKKIENLILKCFLVSSLSLLAVGGIVLLRKYFQRKQTKTFGSYQYSEANQTIKAI